MDKPHILVNGLLTVAFVLLTVGCVSPDWIVSNNKDAAHPLVNQIKLLKHPIIHEGSVGLWRHCYTIKHVDHDNNILMSSDCGSTTDWTGLFSHPDDKKYFQMAQAFFNIIHSFHMPGNVIQRIEKSDA